MGGVAIALGPAHRSCSREPRRGAGGQGHQHICGPKRRPLAGQPGRHGLLQSTSPGSRRRGPGLRQEARSLLGTEADVTPDCRAGAPSRRTLALRPGRRPYPGRATCGAAPEGCPIGRGRPSATARGPQHGARNTDDLGEPVVAQAPGQAQTLRPEMVAQAHLVDGPNGCPLRPPAGVNRRPGAVRGPSEVAHDEVGVQMRIRGGVGPVLECRGHQPLGRQQADGRRRAPSHGEKPKLEVAPPPRRPPRHGHRLAPRRRCRPGRPERRSTSARPA